MAGSIKSGYFSFRPYPGKTLTAKLSDGKFVLPAKTPASAPSDHLEHVQLVRPGVLRSLTNGILPRRSPKKKTSAASANLQQLLAQSSRSSSKDSLLCIEGCED